MPRTKTADHPGASSSGSLPPQQATRRPPVDHSDPDSVEDPRQLSLSPDVSNDEEVHQDYEDDDPTQPFQEARVDL